MSYKKICAIAPLCGLSDKNSRGSLLANRMGTQARYVNESSFCSAFAAAHLLYSAWKCYRAIAWLTPAVK